MILLLILNNGEVKLIPKKYYKPSPITLKNTKIQLIHNVSYKKFTNVDIIVNGKYLAKIG